MPDRPPLEVIDPEAAARRKAGKAPVDPTDPAAQTDERAPGCGLAAYAFLLLGISVVGMVGMTLGTIGILYQATETNPRALTSGTEAGAWRLQPLRDAGVLGPDEVPGAYHDESPDLMGSAACALTADRAIRVQDGEGRSLAYADMADIELMVLGSGEEVVLMTARPDTDATDLACRFGPDEGANQLMRQVQVELLKVKRSQEVDAPE